MRRALSVTNPVPVFVNMTHLQADDPVVDELEHIGNGNGGAGGSAHLQWPRHVATSLMSLRGI